MFTLTRCTDPQRGYPWHKSSQNEWSGSARRDAIAVIAENRLRRSAYMSVGQLRCDYEDGVLRLCGRLPSYYLKQIAQNTVADIEGVDEIVNDVEVSPPAPRRS
jgi:osmotically-inducible protein OsmY